ncbi:MAG TPA: DNA adenine methylase [Erysipelotrichaceae bacterium]|nr:DNA adenine methylase [Erysipelotrichaceae bacterium]
MYKVSPFVKWAGGKRQVMNHLLELKPKKFKRYYEPFVGGGALLLELTPIQATINDSNKELMYVYRCLRNKKLFKKFYDTCKEHEAKHSEKYYYEIRSMDKKKNVYAKLPTYIKAARCVYLNKACFNGLYRVNKKGQFNVPSGKYEKIRCFDEDNINALHEYFNKNKPIILNKDFAQAVKAARAGDFVYIDPPYDVTGQQSFTSYTTGGFDRKEQERLRNVIKELTEKGVLVMANNANTNFIQELYKDFNIHVIEARRSINSKADGRGKVEEVIITNY